MPIPLLRIPDIPLRYVARHLSKVELVKISLCSRRVDRALKRCGQKELSYFKIAKSLLNQLEHLELSLLEAGRTYGGVCTTHRLQLTVSFFDSVRIKVSYNGSYVYSFRVECFNKLNQFAGILKGFMIKDTYIPVLITADNDMQTFWNNRADGLIFLLKCFNEKFKNVVHKLGVYRKVMPDASQSLMKFVDYTALSEVSLIGVHIDQGVQMPIKEFQYILENVKFRDPSDVRCEFSSCCKVDEKFKFHSTISCYKLFLYLSHWITLQYLLECKHREIRVAGSKFTNEEIKVYMNQWVAGTIPDVQDVHVDMIEPFKVDYVLSGLQRCKTRLSWIQSRSDNLYVLIKGAGDKVARVRKDWFKMEVYSDPNATIVENNEEQSDESEEDEDEEESSGDEDTDEDEEGDIDEEEEDEEDEDMEEDEEENVGDDDMEED